MSKDVNDSKKTILKKDFKKQNRRSFLIAGASALLGAVGLNKILEADVAADDAVAWPLRQGFLANQKLWTGLYAPTRENSGLPAPAAGTKGRINGNIGLDQKIELADWELEYESPTMKRTLTLADLQKFPRKSSHAEFRCIEGWSMAIGFDGILFSEFLKTVDPEGAKMSYVGLETPEAEYYVSIDMASMLHAQTVLADTMNGAPLGAEHGEPLRLIIPVKYGIKNLKRIGRIFLSNERPPDYWAENGYDWYSGL